MFKRILAASLLAAAVTLAVPAGSVPPAGAQPGPPVPVHVSGNFLGDAREEVFSYLPGSVDPDNLAVFDNGGVPGGPLTLTIHPFDVAGNSYVPVAGDFDGDGHDELFFHGPGAIPDSMWHFQSTSSVVSVPFTVNGSYQPLVGNYTGDAADDIHWYAPGPAGDPLWEFNQGGTFGAIGRNVNGTYRPVVASVGKDNTDDTIWYGPGSTPDSLWDWTRGTTSHTTQTLSVGGSTYLPFEFDYFGDGPRGEDIYWYAQGTTGDPVWDYLFGTILRDIDNITSPFDDSFDVAVAGDYFGDGLDDVLFITNADLTDFTLYDSSFEQDFVYDITPVTSSSTGVVAQAVEGAKAAR